MDVKETPLEGNTSNIELNDDGTVTVYESAPDRQRRVARNRVESIREKISDANFDPAEVSRLIAVEIAMVAGELVGQDVTSGVVGTAKLKAYSEQIKALRELGKQLSDADVLSKRDFLNFDGPKFMFVFEIVVGIFVQAMKEAGVPEDLRNSILKHFRDAMQMAEPQIRKDTARIDSNK